MYRNGTISLKRLFLQMIIFSPFIDLLLEVLVPTLSNKYVFLLFYYGIFIWNTRMSKRKTGLVLIVDCFLLFEAYVNINNYGWSILFDTDFYGFEFFVLWLFLFSDERLMQDLKEIIHDYASLLIKLIIIFVAVTAIYQLFLGSGVQYLQGPFGLPHTLAYFCIELYAIIMITEKEESTTVPLQRKMKLLLKGILVAFVLMTAVRSAALGLAILVAYDYLQIKSFGKKSIIIALCGGVLVFIVYGTNLLQSVPIVSKTIEAANNGSISNGRDIFVEYILAHWQGFSKGDKMLGVGISEIRDIMYTLGRTRIHAHNDFINILVGYGYIGIATTLISLVSFVGKTKFLWILSLIALLMYYNGVFMYLYLCLALPIIKLVFIKQYDSYSVEKCEEIE